MKSSGIESAALNRVELRLRYTIDITDCPSISSAIDTKAKEDISQVIVNYKGFEKFIRLASYTILTSLERYQTREV